MSLALPADQRHSALRAEARPFRVSFTALGAVDARHLAAQPPIHGTGDRSGRHFRAPPEFRWCPQRYPRRAPAVHAPRSPGAPPAAPAGRAARSRFRARGCVWPPGAHLGNLAAPSPHLAAPPTHHRQVNISAILSRAAASAPALSSPGHGSRAAGRPRTRCRWTARGAGRRTGPRHGRPHGPPRRAAAVLSGRPARRPRPTPPAGTARRQRQCPPPTGA